jgi:hypothetical protein
MCLVYIDDILIFSRTFEQHLIDIETVFGRLCVANLKLKTSKCKFAYPSTLYLGHLRRYSREPSVHILNNRELDPAKLELPCPLSIDCLYYFNG